MHAIYQVQSFNLVALTDTGHNLECQTVTNDIEHVLATLTESGRLIKGHPYQRVIYCDSDGYWDKVIIDTGCNFVTFAPLSTNRREEFRLGPDADPRMIFATMLLHEASEGTGGEA
jgi:hypothetical protein